MNYIYFSTTLIIILTFLGCSNNISETSNEILSGQYVEKNKDGLVEKIGHFNNGNREGIFLYFDKKGKLQAQEKAQAQAQEAQEAQGQARRGRWEQRRRAPTRAPRT